LKTVDCILLGAGRSARMGSPKLLAPLGDRTLFETVLTSYTASSLRSVCAVVAGWLPGFAAIAARYENERVHFLQIARPCVMSESLKTGWTWVQEHQRPDGVMISLADKAAVGTETIDLMVRSYSAGDHAICVPVHAGRWGHPVVISSSLGEEILRIEGDRGAVEVLAAHRSEVREIPVETDEVLFDIDSAADLAALKARLGLEREC